MENVKLLDLLEADREMVMADIARDRSPAAAQAALEKAVDRVTYRFIEQCGDPATREAGQLALQTMKQSMMLVDSVGEVRRWQKTVSQGEGKRKLGPLGLLLLAGGVLLVLAVMLGLLFTGGRLAGVLTLLEALIPAGLGMAALFFAGVQSAKPPRKKGEEPAPDVRDEFLVDPDRLWRHLRAMMLLADSALEGVAGRAEAARRREMAETESTALPAAQAELFAGLLESAYALDTAEGREMAEAIRFHLHAAGVEVVDYEKGREAWFEFLPARRKGTIRPALASGQKLVRKGLASA